MSVLLRFYMVSCAFVTSFFAVAVITRNRDLRVRSWTLFLLTQIICAALWIGPIGFGAICLLLFALGANEFLRHCDYPAKRRVWITSLGFAFYAMTAFGHGLAFVVLPMYALVTVISFFSPVLWVKRPLFAGGFVASVIGYGAGFLHRMDVYTLDAVVSFLLLLQCNDAFGYLVGRIFGKHRVFPVLSPRKSLEGYVGGAVGIAIGIALLYGVIAAVPHIGSSRLLLLGCAAFLIGNVGDLLFSAVKRKLQVKDFSQLFPGHGGILDRFDNVLFGAPLFYLAWYFIVQ